MKKYCKNCIFCYGLTSCARLISKNAYTGTDDADELRTRSLNKTGICQIYKQKRWKFWLYFRRNVR